MIMTTICSRYLLRQWSCYCDVNWCPGVWYLDCFTRFRPAGVGWWNPNPRDVGRVLLKVLRDGALGSLLLPGCVAYCLVVEKIVP